MSYLGPDYTPDPYIIASPEYEGPELTITSIEFTDTAEESKHMNGRVKVSTGPVRPGTDRFSFYLSAREAREAHYYVGQTLKLVQT